MCAQLSIAAAAAAVVHDADFVVAEDAQTCFCCGPKSEPGSRGFAAVDGPLVEVVS